MKKLFLILLLAKIGIASFSQNILDSIHPLFKGELDGDLIRKYFTSASGSSFNQDKGFVINGQLEPQIILTVFYSNNMFLKSALAPVSPSPELKVYGREPKPIYQNYIESANGESNRFLSHYAIPLFDSTRIIVIASGINRKNAHEYEFRVIENRKNEIIPWRSIKLFCESYTLRTNPDGTEEMEVGYLGEFITSFGNGLTFEIRKKESQLFLTSISGLWINRFPAVLATFSNNDMRDFLAVFKYQWKYDFFTPNGSTYYGDMESPSVDSLLVKRNNFYPEENSIIFYLEDKIKSKEIIEYNLVKGNDSSGWEKNDFDMNLIWLKNLSPGKYVLKMRYSLQRQNISHYDFSVAAAWHQTLAFKLIAGILAMVFVSFFIILYKSQKQKRKLRNEQFRKQQIQTELKSIRAQFNPHFVFNALGSIQGLITRNDMEGANKFLTVFSSLLRDSLKQSSHENVSLAKEIKTLGTYLELEKLRFGFEYSIDTDDSIETNHIEVPFLLLQPIVENAVKHGVASLYEKGRISIDFKKSSNDLVALVSDNGPGFKSEMNTEGYGIKMTRERLELLNKTFLDQSIKIDFNSSSNGTSVSLIFKNWFS